MSLCAISLKTQLHQCLTLMDRSEHAAPYFLSCTDHRLSKANTDTALSLSCHRHRIAVEKKMYLFFLYTDVYHRDIVSD